MIQTVVERRLAATTIASRRFTQHSMSEEHLVAQNRRRGMTQLTAVVMKFKDRFLRMIMPLIALVMPSD